MFIFSETAFHHEGDVNFLNNLINESKKSLAQGVKFQVLFDINSFISKKNSNYSLVQKSIISKEDWKEAFLKTNGLNLKVIIMPCDNKVVESVIKDELFTDFLEIHSIMYNDYKFLQLIKDSAIPIILSIGGRNITEIDEKINFFGDQIYCLMVGFQAFPTKISDINIEKINTLKRMYPKLNIGYADHCDFSEERQFDINLHAFRLGADVFEKHITFNEGVIRTDYISAVGGKKFKRLVKKLDTQKERYDKIFDADLNFMSESEIIYRNRQKCCVINKSKKLGEIIYDDDVDLKMTNSIGISSVDKVIGKKLLKNVYKDDTINKDYLDN